MGVEAYMDGVGIGINTVGVGIGIILWCVTNVTSNVQIKQLKPVDLLKGGSKRDTNETPIYAVPVHAPHASARW